MKRRLRILVRADAGPSIGGGHVMRCLALADALRARGHDVVWRSQGPTREVVPALGASGLREADAAEPCDVVVVDHYGLALDEERALAAACGARHVVVIDDLADRMHDCALLIDAGPARRREDYRGLVPRAAACLLGPSAALLRRDFAALRPASLARRAEAAGRLGRLAIAFGLSDATPHVAAAVAAVAKALPGTPCDVIVGPAGAVAAAALLAGRADMALHVDPPDYPAILARADLAIGAAGGGAWERCALGLPSVAVAIAPNQKANAQALTAAGAARLAAPGPRLAHDLAAQLARLEADPQACADLGRAAAGLCDGEGAGRVAAAIEALGEAQGAASASPPRRGTVHLRAAGRADAGRLLAWRNDPATRAASRRTGAVAPADHAAWLARRLAEPDPGLFVAEREGEPVGTIRLDRRDDGTAEISLAVSPLARGEGVAGAMLARIGERAHAAATPLVASVRADNAASRRLFLAAGFGERAGEDGWLHFARA